MNKLVTVFTPLYNRKDLLPRLYESLRAQTCVGYEPFHMVYETINLTKQCSMKYACEMRDYPVMKAKRIYGRLQGFLKGKA